MFEGEYLNGEKNGKGKKYNNKGELIFEGEYLDREKRKGIGNEYDYDVLFEGEYFNGVKWNGKGYDDKGNIIYELINGNGNIIE